LNVEAVIRVTVAARALRQRGGTSDEMARVPWREKIMRLERIEWKRTNGKQLLLDKVYDAVTEEFTRDAMAALATVLAHLCIATNVAKRQAIEAFDDAYDHVGDMVSGQRCQ
jgi:hypothetical protein